MAKSEKIMYIKSMKKIFCIAATVAALTIQAEAQEGKGEFLQKMDKKYGKEKLTEEQKKAKRKEIVEKFCPKGSQIETANGWECKEDMGLLKTLQNPEKQRENK